LTDSTVKIAAVPVAVIMRFKLGTVHSSLALTVFVQFYVTEPSSLEIKLVLLKLELFSHILCKCCFDLKRELPNLLAEFDVVPALLQLLLVLSWE
jgi:hypothetical protein